MKIHKHRYITKFFGKHPPSLQGRQKKNKDKIITIKTVIMMIKTRHTIITLFSHFK